MNAVQRQRGEQQEYHFAGKQIAVETQRQRDGPRQKRHDFQQQIYRNQQHFHHDVLRNEGLHGQLADESPQALHLDAVVNDEHEHRQRHRERGVEIGGGYDFEVLDADAMSGPRQQIDGENIHRVEEQHPTENGQRQRREQFVGAVKAVLDLGIDELHHQLDEILEFARYAGIGLARRKIKRAAEQQRQRDGEKYGVPVDDGKIHYSLGFLVGEERQVME